MTAAEAQAMRTRTRNRAIARLIENHRDEFDAMVAEERGHATAWESRLLRPAVPIDDLSKLRETILIARRQC